jgi:hypothetical protein
MARKKIGRILSGGAIVLCVFLFCTVDVGAQFVAQEITYTISGSTGVSGVTMKGLPNQPVTDENGFYTATVKYGWKGTVTPMKEGYNFEPRSKSYQEVTDNMNNEDYAGTPITFTISGKAGMEGVEMSGLPGNPITGSDGSYSATVEYGWKGTVTPIKEGYKFTPSNKGYPPVKSNKTTENYTVEPVTLIISGTTGLEGVVMNGLPDNPVTRKDGVYLVKVNYDWSGTVTPTKEGYDFEPVEQQYSNVIVDQTFQNYTATVLSFEISGTAGMEGVEMKGLPGNPVTDENGYYTVVVDYGFSGTITPTKAGYTFEPASMTYTKVNSERVDQSYRPTMITLTISGTTKMDGVEMNGLPGNPITGTDGSYKVTVDYDWSGTVTPMKDGYEFSPESKTYPSVTKDQTNNNYTASKLTFTISGSAGISGVTMKGLPGRAVITGVDGSYSASVQWGWSGTVTPMKDGYDFEPASIEYSNLMGPETNRSYTPTTMKHKISGTIISDKGQPVEEVFVLADTGGGSATTSTNGEYELFVNHGWRGTVTPSTEGYTFRPTKKQYTSVTRDQTRQGFTAIVRTFTISDVMMMGTTPLTGVLITATNGGSSDTTDAKGKYSVTVPYNWSGEIIPTKKGINFNPPSISYTDVVQNIKGGVPEVPTQPLEPTPPTPTPPTPTPPEPTPPVPTPPEPTPTIPTPPDANLPPKTALEQDIARIQEQLEKLLLKQTGEEVPTVPGEELPPEPAVPLISYTFVDGDIAMEVLPIIAEQAGISIIPDENVIGMVTCDLKDQPLDRALEIVLAGTPYVVKKTPYYYLVCAGTVTDPLFPVVSETRTVRLNYITAEAAVGLLSSAFRNYAQAEPAAPGTETYTVAVTAPPALMNRIVSDLRQIDRLPSHVLLDARIVVMERGDLLNLGVEWGFPKIKAGIFGSDHKGHPTADTVDYGGDFPWGVQMGYTPTAEFTNSLELTLNLLAQNGEATIVAKPQVLAQDGRQAQIQVTTEEYYMLTAPELSGSFYMRTELAEITSGTTLTITPHIGDNNDITLTMSVEVSDSIPRGRGSDLPVVTRRTADNTVRIKDGGTVAVAGLTENRTRKDLRRVPGLSNIPVLGTLFKNKNNESSSREIAVFVTAHIVPEHRRTIGFSESEPSSIQSPIEPAGEDFRASLRESLSRQIR